MSNFNEIERGMTRAEVVAILGGPPGDYTVFRSSQFCTFRWAGGYFLNGRHVQEVDEQWFSDAGTILLRFRRDKVVLRMFAGGGEIIADSAPRLVGERD